MSAPFGRRSRKPKNLSEDMCVGTLLLLNRLECVARVLPLIPHYQYVFSSDTIHVYTEGRLTGFSSISSLQIQKTYVSTRRFYSQLQPRNTLGTTYKLFSSARGKITHPAKRVGHHTHTHTRAKILSPVSGGMFSKIDELQLAT